MEEADIRASRNCGRLRSIVQDDAQERTVNVQSAVVLDEAELAKFVHEETDAAAGGADISARVP